MFVSRFLEGVWQPPIQVDGSQPFAATFPAIAAGDGGRLLVVWAEPWAVIGGETRYQLMSSELDPGAQQFGPAQQVDPGVKQFTPARANPVDDPFSNVQFGGGQR